MNALLIAINAKYPHTNLAVRSIAAYGRRFGRVCPSVAEFNINQPRRAILRQLCEAGADVYLFSCYLWNWGMIRPLIEELRKVRPAAVIALGGPEVSWNAEDVLRELPEVDFVMRGEGEETARELLDRLEAGEPLRDCAGLSYREGGEVRHTGDRPLLPMEKLPFPYDDLDRLGDRVIYYESMRGCPYRCGYCISSLEGGVRMRPLPLVLDELALLLSHRVRAVKLVDRTFNCDRERAMMIWRFLTLRDNGVTAFHFEIAGDLLDDGAIRLLGGARPGLFEMEVGVQSTHLPTLEATHRQSDLPRLFEQVGKLRQTDGVHLHLDLIAGLPYEGYRRFIRSFNEVYALSPHQLQLGFLKVLHGSPLEREAQGYGIVYQRSAPYEVLRTDWLSFDELSLLHGVEEMVGAYHNSGRFTAILAHIIGLFPTPYDCFLALWEHFERVTGGAPLSKIGYYELLGSFLERQGLPVDETARWLCRFDLLRHEKPRRLPDWVTADGHPDHREAVRRFFADRESTAEYLPGLPAGDTKQAARIAHLEVFPFDPRSGEPDETALLFDYRERDVLGRARVRSVTLLAEGE